MINLNEKLTKSILDPIHGLIRMTEEEMSIISHELFNRLRRIKQNTFLYYVFPSANHTRFEHSIGVMHLASEMYLNAFQNSNTLKQKREKYNLSDNDNILSLDQFPAFEEIFWDLRIAALLHDIGHGPMSHLFDEFAPINEDFLNLIREDTDPEKEGENLINILADAFERIFKEQGALRKKVEHEYVSYYFALTVLKETGITNERIKNILSIMNGKLALTSIETKVNGSNYQLLPLLNHIVAGAPLDCDRMDYLLRDSYFTGVKYGTYDLNRLLKSLLPFVDSEKKILRLGIKKSGLPAIENFLQARYELFIQVYFHKTNTACNSMLSHATRDLVKAGLKFLKFENPSDLRNRYLVLSDEYFLKIIKEELEETSEEDANTIEDLLNRRLWKRVLEIHPEKGREREKDLDEILEKSVKWILENYENMDPYVTKNLITTNPVKDLDKEKAVLLVKDEDEKYLIEDDKDWLSDSIIFKALSSRYMVGRVYLKVETNNQESKEQFRTIKKELQKIIS